MDALGDDVEIVGDLEPPLFKRARPAVHGKVALIGELALSFRLLGQLARGDSR